MAVVLAGCSVPFGDVATPTASPDQSRSLTPDQTPSASPNQTPTAIPNRTPTPTASPNRTSTDTVDQTSTATPLPASSFPPGVSQEGVANATALVAAHVHALNETGYVAVGRGTTAVLRSGFVVGVTTRARTVVAPGSDRYYEVRDIDAGPINRLAERYSNGTVERFRRTENGVVTHEMRSPRGAATLASASLLESLLEGGEFNVTSVDVLNDTVVVELRANRTDNVTAVHDSLPEAADQVRSYEATASVDTEGRILRLNATVGFVIGGSNRTHRVGYAVRELGVDRVPAPDWVNETTSGAG